MTLVPITATALSAWVPYLINGDSSGLDREDIEAADKFAEYLGAAPVSCEPTGFLRRPDSFQFMPVGGECETYTALIEESNDA